VLEDKQGDDEIEGPGVKSGQVAVHVNFESAVIIVTVSRSVHHALRYVQAAYFVEVVGQRHRQAANATTEVEGSTPVIGDEADLLEPLHHRHDLTVTAVKELVDIAPTVPKCGAGQDGI